MDKAIQIRCSDCRIKKDSGCFSKNKTRKNGLNGTCKDCHKLYREENKEKMRKNNLAYKKTNKEKIKKKRPAYLKNNREHIRQRVRANKLKVKYGMTVEDYNLMYKKQNGRCAICYNYHEKLVVDHCHETSKVRGLLCGSCNRGLGMFRDNKIILEQALIYLSK